jgi:hypothetical protein
VTEVTTQAVVDKIFEAENLLSDFTIQAATNLDSVAANQSNNLSNEEMAKRVTAAIAILRGDAPTINDHTFIYRVVGPTTDLSQESYIHEKLGADAEYLIQELKDMGVEVSGKVPNLNQVSLDTGSNNKTRLEQNRHYEGGLADIIQATNIAIEAICAAKTARIDLSRINSESLEDKGSRIKAEALKAGLNEGTATVLEKLTAGLIIVGGPSAGALYIRRDGRLHAAPYYDACRPDYFAFGACM